MDVSEPAILILFGVIAFIFIVDRIRAWWRSNAWRRDARQRRKRMKAGAEDPRAPS